MFGAKKGKEKEKEKDDGGEEKECALGKRFWTAERRKRSGDVVPERMEGAYYDDPLTRRVLRVLKEEGGFDDVLRFGFPGEKMTMKVTMSRDGVE